MHRGDKDDWLTKQGVSAGRAENRPKSLEESEASQQHFKTTEVKAVVHEQEPTTLYGGKASVRTEWPEKVLTGQGEKLVNGPWLGGTGGGGIYDHNCAGKKTRDGWMAYQEMGRAMSWCWWLQVGGGRDRGAAEHTADPLQIVTIEALGCFSPESTNTVGQAGAVIRWGPHWQVQHWVRRAGGEGGGRTQR